MTMSEWILFIIIVAITFYMFIRKGKAMAGMMGELAKRGTDIDAQVTKKYQTTIMSKSGGMIKNKHLIYSFTLNDGNEYSKKISPSHEQWETLEEGDTLPVVYLAENPDASTTKELVDQIRAAMHKKNITKN